MLRTAAAIAELQAEQQQHLATQQARPPAHLHAQYYKPWQICNVCDALAPSAR
jgi:hypothetical protein